MKKYQIFKHPSKEIRVVKSGFSWGGFLLGWLGLMLFHKLLKKGFLFLLIGILIAILSNAIGSIIGSNRNNGQAFASFFSSGGSLIISIIIGAKANEWTKTHLLKNGYVLALTADAKPEKDELKALAQE